MNKTLHNSCASGASENVKDIEFWGNGDSFKLISKASSESEGWMKSTKAMDTGTGCLVQVTTQQRNLNGSYSIAEALTFVPGVTIMEAVTNTEDGTSKVTARFLLPPETAQKLKDEAEEKARAANIQNEAENLGAEIEQQAVTANAELTAAQARLYAAQRAMSELKGEETAASRAILG